ncbi:MAG: homoaconitate hydratase, partial [Ectothiorhodospiraceae bacterium]|nr:homoaconitate hydratase [Ectothiorhodospiraceae bacterium]
PAGRGIGHQIMCEEGYAWPGTMVVASDSHSNMYGGMGCLGTPVVRTDAAAIWATGKTWWQVPPVAKVELTGSLRKGVTGKDVIVTLCGIFNNDEVLNHAVEFVGDGVASLGLNERLTIANMTTEWGALTGLFPVDDVAIDWLIERVKFIVERGLEGVPSDEDGDGTHPRVRDSRVDDLIANKERLNADENAQYAKHLILDLSTVEPCVSGPNSVKKSSTVANLSKERIPIQKAYLVSCVNSRLDDIAEAAQAIQGRKVADGVEFYIAAASSEVQKESERLGYWQTLLDAGAKPLPAGCGPCIGLGAGLLKEGEIGISATNRNFKGRMGSPDAQAYLGSPAVVAASAAVGYIALPDALSSGGAKATLETVATEKGAPKKTDLVPGFPDHVLGPLVFCYQDNMNTDGIYPGKYTYNDDMTGKDQAKVVMENYDPDFRAIARENDILAGGYNFGMGSSREQAATALKHFGIQLVIAGSVGQTYQRNAINNGFVVLESPEFTEALKEKFGEFALTQRSELVVDVSFEDSTIQYEGKTFGFSPLGKPAQEIIVSGGLEEWIRKSLR